MKKVAIIGGTGYGAIELIRLLQHHPKMEVTKVTSHSQAGEDLATVYPHLLQTGHIKLEELNIATLKEEVDIVFLATPAGIAKDLVLDLLDSNLQIIDLSGDFRLSTEAEYKEWYGKDSAPQAILDQATYGLAELYPEKIKETQLLSNPGCFPTSALLGLMPAVKAGITETKGIVIDGKTGISGAGRTPSAATHFSEANDNVVPYKVGQHQHTPEIEKYLSETINEQVNVTFTPHLIPMTRGLICTMYIPLKKAVSTQEVIELYQTAYEGNEFVRILPEGQFPQTKAVQGSNFCDIGIYSDPRSQQLIIASAIDNLVKGASGQAIQNANIMNGWEEGLGLFSVPMYP